MCFLASYRDTKDHQWPEGYIVGCNFEYVLLKLFVPIVKLDKALQAMYKGMGQENSRHMFRLPHSCMYSSLIGDHMIMINVHKMMLYIHELRKNIYKISINCLGSF